MSTDEYKNAMRLAKNATMRGDVLEKKTENEKRLMQRRLSWSL
jgi:hypothetical protein